MASVVLICNLALASFGQTMIESLSNVGAEEKWCNQFYAHARDTITESAIWRHAGALEFLAEQTTNDRDDDFYYAYQRPSDCLKLRYLLPETGIFDRRYLVKYELIGDTIYTDEELARAAYIRQVVEPQNFGPAFTNVVAMYLATLIVMPLTQDRQKRADVVTLYADAWRQAFALNEAEQLDVGLTADEAQAEWHQGR